MCFFWFFCSFVCLFFGVHSCLLSSCLLVHLAIHWWLFVIHYRFVLHRHLVDIFCSLNELFISPCCRSSSPYYSSLPCVVYCHLMFLIVALCCLPLHCCHHHCIVITIITPLFVLPSITSTSNLIVSHYHIALCLTPPYCGDGISPLLSMCKLLIVCALCIVEVSTKATFTFQKVIFFFHFDFLVLFLLYMLKVKLKCFCWTNWMEVLDRELCYHYWTSWTKEVSMIDKVDRSRGWLCRIKTDEAWFKLFYGGNLNKFLENIMRIRLSNEFWNMN